MASIRSLLALAVVLASCAGKQTSLQGRHFSVVTVEVSVIRAHLCYSRSPKHTRQDPPFITVRAPNSTVLPSAEWHGFVLSILKLVSERAGFTYSLRLAARADESRVPKDVQ